MTSITDEEFDGLLSNFERKAIHLETRDAYGTAMMTERIAVGATGFWIFDNALVVLETPTASIEVNRPQELELYARMFEALKSPAVYGRAARDLITKAIDELSSRTGP